MTKPKVSSGAQIALVVVILLAIAAGGYFFVIGPKRAEASDLDRQIAAVQVQIEAYRAKSQQPPPVSLDVAELFRLTKAMPDRVDISEVILELNRIARDTGITFQSIAPQPSVPGATFQTLPISLTFDGNFYSLSDFLFRLRNLVSVHDGRLEAHGRLFSVQAIAFTESVQQFPNIQAALTVNAFVYGTGVPATAPPPTAAPPAATTPPPLPTQPAPPAASAAPATGGTS